MTPEQLREQIADVETQISTLQRQYGSLKAELALQVCEFKPGDIIEWGRTVRYRARVESGRSPDWQNRCTYAAIRILKDGRDGKPVVVSPWNSPVKVEE